VLAELFDPFLSFGIPDRKIIILKQEDGAVFLLIMKLHFTNDVFGAPDPLHLSWWLRIETVDAAETASIVAAASSKQVDYISAENLWPDITANRKWKPIQIIL
jgi:hypothetical protein